jgi:hypothetical protein
MLQIFDFIRCKSVICDIVARKEFKRNSCDDNA